MLAKLAIEMKTAKAHSIHHLARMQKSDLSDCGETFVEKRRNRFAQFRSELWKNRIRMNLAVIDDERRARRLQSSKPALLATMKCCMNAIATHVLAGSPVSRTQSHSPKK